MLRWLKRAFTQNLLLKFTAVVCAVVVWAYVNSFLWVERKVPVKVEIVSPWPRIAKLVETDGRARFHPDIWAWATVGGPKELVELMGMNIHAGLYVPRTSPDGDVVVPLTERTFSLPKRMVLIDFEPRQLKMRITKALPEESHFQGQQ
jgi:hypothetical protein